MLKFTGERVVPQDMSTDDPTLREHLARYKFALPYCENRKVLDAACGTGYGTQMLGAIGVDVSPEAVAHAKEYYGVDAYVYDLERGFKDSKYDVITSFETIEHLENPHKFLASVAKNCEQFIFSIPILNVSAFHKQIYSVNQAQKLIEKYFKYVEWWEQTGTVIVPSQSVHPVFLIGIASN